MYHHNLPTTTRAVLLDSAPSSSPSQPSRSTRQRPRIERCARLIDFEAARRERGLTQQQAADQLGIPRTTLCGWNRRANETTSPLQRAFFESPEGVALLVRIVTASLFVMNLQGGLGVAMVRAFLTHAGLHALVASSESSLRRARSALIAATVAWGDSQDRALAARMTKKPVVICADENFHEGLMLVAIEPVSNFILLERRDKHRDAKTWSCALQHSLSLWPVELCAMIGDEAKGLILCATQMLGIVKGSDLFHVDHTLCRGTAWALSAQVEAAAQQVKAAEGMVQQLEHRRERARRAVKSRKDPYKQIVDVYVAIEDKLALEKRLEEVKQLAQSVRDAIRDLGARFHPVDLARGALCSAEEVEARLLAGFEAVRAAVTAAGVGDRPRVAEALDKAQRTLPSLMATVHGWYRLATTAVASLGLSAAETAWVWSTLLPTVYLDHVVPRGARKEDRARLRATRDVMAAKVKEADSPWHHWSPATRTRVCAVLEGVVALFVRASSCVEGRNSQRALYHHRVHRIPQEHLRALTVVHNYVIRRRDGTTAAERFAGVPHADLFEHLVAQAQVPARPRIRPRREKTPLLAAA